MPRFDEQVARMQELSRYRIVSESVSNPVSIEYKAKGADGNVYAIIKEGTNYFIKKTSDGKENVLESYSYLDDCMHRRDHQYSSYALAKKQMDMKLASVNEAHRAANERGTIMECKNLMESTEASEDMQLWISRQREISRNVDALMNESVSISKANIGVPEAPKTAKFTTKMSAPFEEEAEASLDKDPGLTSKKPEDMGNPFGSKEKAEKSKPAKYAPQGCVACEGDQVNEEATPGDKTFAAGLPSNPGIGSPDGHLMESDEEEDKPVEVLDGDEEMETTDPESKEAEDGEIEISDEDDDVEISDEDEDEDEDGEEEDDPAGMIGDDDDEDEGEEDEDSLESLRKRISELEDRIEELEGDSDEEEEGDILGGDDEDGENILNDEDDEAGEFELEIGKDNDEEEPVNDLDSFMESVSRNVAGQILSEEKMAYATQRRGSEFGKHPGYRKRPMTLPVTGPDRVRYSRDWNDSSVYSEEPFGKEQNISSSAPFELLVDGVVNKVMAELRKRL